MAAIEYFFLSFFLLLSVYGPQPATAAFLDSYNVNASAISVSGISAGGYMAVQFHVSYSKSLIGAGVVAGGPYWCAKDDVEVALHACMDEPENIDVSGLVGATMEAATALSIDDPKWLLGDRVYLYSGLNDTVVVQGVMEKLETYYTSFLNQDDIKTVFDVPSEHAFISSSYGNACMYLGAPYINNCGYDQAYEILDYIYGDIQQASNNGSLSNILEFDQAEFFLDDPLLVSMGLQGYVYVPTACQTKQIACSLHVAFHGCLQSAYDVGLDFVQYAGYNGHAELNNIIVLYPQTHPIADNPKSCFDWWGYTSPAYATKLGPQIAGISLMIDRLMGLSSPPPSPSSFSHP